MIQIKGLTQIEKKLDELSDPDKIQKAMGKACAKVEKDARKKAPVKTGALRRSITSKVEMDGNDVKGLIFTPMEYAPYMEYGTGLFAEKGGRNKPWSYQNAKGEWFYTAGSKPHPFMRPALDENREEIIRLL